MLLYSIATLDYDQVAGYVPDFSSNSSPEKTRFRKRLIDGEQQDYSLSQLRLCNCQSSQDLENYWVFKELVSKEVFQILIDGNKKCPKSKN